jgi:hypothetical protein
MIDHRMIVIVIVESLLLIFAVCDIIYLCILN